MISLNIFKKTNKIDRLYKKRQKLLEEAYRLSKVNRTLADQKIAEAEAILRQVQAEEV